MKIGIITCWDTMDNYGQQLQLFALQHYLRYIGHDAYLIKYSPLQYTSKLSLFLEKIKEFVKLLIVNIFPKLTKKTKYKLWYQEYKKALLEKNKNRQFTKFRAKYIHSTTNVYTTLSELQRNAPEADAYITGSDQVWHDSLFLQGAGGYFLQFGKPGILRISYAASIGRTITKKEKDIFKKYLSNLDYISVRERSAKEECIKVGISNVEIVNDPTFLLSNDAYEDILNDGNIVPLNRPYIFIYILNIGTTEDIGWSSIEPYVKKQNLDVKVVASSGYLPALELIPGYSNIYATIPQWLALIKYANYVITSSFHGIVFSILYHRPFLAILLKGHLRTANSRIINLLENLNLKERVFNMSRPLKEQIGSPIDWNTVDNKVKELRQKGISFLNKSLK